MEHRSASTASVGLIVVQINLVSVTSPLCWVLSATYDQSKTARGIILSAKMSFPSCTHIVIINVLVKTPFNPKKFLKKSCSASHQWLMGEETLDISKDCIVFKFWFLGVCNMIFEKLNTFYCSYDYCKYMTVSVLPIVRSLVSHNSEAKIVTQPHFSNKIN